MFLLHDRVRRRICLTGFFLLCVLPTVVVLGWAVAWRLPGHVRAEARRIGWQLGMDLSLGGVEHRRPGAVRLTNVVLRDCESPEAVLQCPRLDAEWRTVTDKSGASRRVLMLQAGTIAVDAARMTTLGKLARRLFELRAGNVDVDVRLAVETVEVGSGGQSEQFTKVHGAMQTLESGTEGWIEFRETGQQMTRPAWLRLGRNRHVGPPGDWFDLNTGGAALPCGLLGQGIRPMKSLGANARFRGYLCATSTATGWQGGIWPCRPEDPPCEFLDVELDRLITDRFPHVLSGTASVQLRQAVVREGRIEQVEGSVLANHGTISPSLVKAAVEHLGLQQGAEPVSGDTPIHFARLACRFRLDRNNGLRIRGGLDDTEPEPVLVGRQGWLLGPTVRSCSAVAVIRAMVPDSTVLVPATPQTDWLAPYLPTPEIAPAAARERSRLATDEHETVHR
ncbi:MAG: hypothetical protein JW888_18900 [Pirellulales bacterium]|nr:hypothetical protein [Pirellulales bacterium]